MLPRPWGKVAVPEDDAVALRLGFRDLWLARSGQDLRTAHVLADAEVEGSPGPPEGATWTRWALPAGFDGHLALRPALPDRPLVVEPRTSMHLMKGAGTRILVPIPLFIRMEPHREEGTMLEEIPSEPLSDTWLGSFTEGEMAYWLSVGMEPPEEADAPAAHVAVCRVELTNRTNGDLYLERLPLRAPNLTLFKGSAGFVTDVAKVRYQGDADLTEQEVSGRPPPGMEGAEPVAKPREGPKGGIRSRAFTQLLNLTPGAPSR